MQPVTVQTTVAIVTTNQAVEQVVGNVRPRASALISAKVSGRVRKLTDQIGRQVKSGETVAEIDAAEIGARAEQARAGLDNATRELSRFRQLLTQSAVTQSEFDTVEARHRVAKATVAEAEAMSAYTIVSAPFDGAIARKLADVGDLASPGHPLLEIESIGAVRFEAGIPEALAGRVHLGQKLMIQVDGISMPIAGTVAEIAPAANALSRTLQIRLDLAAREDLRAGQFGRLAVPINGRTNVRVPEPAVLRRGQMEIVFVDGNGKAQLRLVKTGKRFAGSIEILSGLEAGETVVTKGHAQLRDGQPIQVAPDQ